MLEDDLDDSPSAAFDDDVDKDEGVETVEALAGDADACRREILGGCSMEGVGRRGSSSSLSTSS